MTTAELKEYLGMVVQMEKEVNLQEQLCRQLQQKETGYEHSKEYFVRHMREDDSQQLCVPKRKSTNEDEAKTAIKVEITIIIIEILSYLLAELCEIDFFAYIFMLGLLPAGISAFNLLGMVAGEYSDARKKDESDYNSAMNQYQRKLHKKEEIKKENERCKEQIAELQTQIQVAEAYRQKVENSLATSKRNLEKMYSHNVVFPKYRNYVMVSSIYEYLCAGRCTTLEGHEGAYNILELEIRLDRIITQLDRILQNLAAIQANQYMLYSCLKESNQKLDMLLQEESRIADSMQGLGAQSYEMNRRLGELQHSSELANYLAECNNRQLSYMNRMNYLAGNYDNPYGNYAPV